MSALPPNPVRGNTLTFRQWRQSVIESGSMPVITVTGSRGKSTVIRLLEEIFRHAGFRVATWTTFGVEIEGVRQRGELTPWRKVEERLASGQIDVAIREVDWATAATTHGDQELPLLIVTNLCANRDECLIQGEAKLAARTLPSLLDAVPPSGGVVLNGEDFAVSGDHILGGSRLHLVGLSADSPLMTQHMGRGGTAAWLQQRVMLLGASGGFRSLGLTQDLAFALNGGASFQVHNALTAAAGAALAGVAIPFISAGLKSFHIDPFHAPGSFNLFNQGGAMIVIDRPSPSWYIKPLLRAVRPGRTGRLFLVGGSMSAVPESDLVEVGRLIGRVASVVVAHADESDVERIELLLKGMAQNDLPPHLAQLKTEHGAIARAIRLCKPGDRLLVLSDRPELAVHTISSLVEDSAETGSRVGEHLPKTYQAHQGPWVSDDQPAS